jgi:glycopeptide antibiotics resistance protein
MTRGIQKVAAVLFAVYLIAAAAIVLWPTRVDAPYDGGLFAALRALHDHGVPSFVNYAFVESGANVVMFVPLGFLLTTIFSTRLWWLPTLIGFAASAAGELAQLLFLPNRVASIGDVAANTAGALIGTLLAVAGRELVRARRRARPAIAAR